MTYRSAFATTLLSLSLLSPIAAATTPQSAKAQPPKKVAAVLPALPSPEMMQNQYGLEGMAWRKRLPYLHTLNKSYKVIIPSEQRSHIEDQGRSGRCVTFALTRQLLGKAFNKGVDVEALSQSYVNYHLLLTRAEHTLRKLSSGVPMEIALSEGSLHTANEQVVSKHGVVPKTMMPETQDAADSSRMLSLLDLQLAKAQEEFGAVSNAPKDWPEAGKRKQEIYHRHREKILALLNRALGTPPDATKTFDHEGRTYTPKTFASALGFRPVEYVMLISSPKAGMKINTAYRMPASQGVQGFTLFNVPRAVMYDAIQRQIRDHGEAVPFGTKVGAENPFILDHNHPNIPSWARGFMDRDAFDYGDVVDLPSRRAMVNAGLGNSNHAMNFVAYDYAASDPKQKITQLKVANSWGTSDASDANGAPAWDGYFHMKRNFADDYLVRVVVRKDTLHPRLLQHLQRQAPRDLP